MPEIIKWLFWLQAEAPNVTGHVPFSVVFWIVAMFVAGIATMFSTLMVFINKQNASNVAREKGMAQAIGQLEQFQRTELIQVIRSNAELFKACIEAMHQATAASVELKEEIHEMRIESRQRTTRTK